MRFLRLFAATSNVDHSTQNMELDLENGLFTNTSTFAHTDYIQLGTAMQRKKNFKCPIDTVAEARGKSFDFNI